MTVNEPDRVAAATVRRPLLAWYRRYKRDLPWRGSVDPYRVWVSEIILQQTRVDQGLPYYERFLAAFPTVEALAQAPLGRVLKSWEGLGYYTRARNLHAAARSVVAAGRFPETARGWQELPGVGRYTANAIASFVYGERVPIVDGNVQRVLTRLYDIADSIDAGPTQKLLWDLAGSLVPAKNPGEFNQALMELGACVCSPRKPLCAGCPLQRQCQARAAGTQEARPVRATKKRVPQIKCAAAVIERRGQLLLARRPASGMLGGLWEFPCVEVESWKEAPRALVRWLQNELHLEVKVSGQLGAVKHTYSHRKVDMRVYECACTRGRAKTGPYEELTWAAPGELDQYPMPGICKKALRLRMS